MKEWIFTTDHKRVGISYLVGSMAAFAVAGTMALLIRMEQFNPGPGITDNPHTYNTWLYFHGAAMILAFLIPGLTGFAANYFLPLMIGAPDVAFPRVNSFSVMLFWLAIVLALLNFVIPDPADIMWTGYPPYSVMTEGNTAWYVFVVHMMGFSSILGAINFLTTVIYMRAPGMGWNQLNVFVWGTVTAFVMQLIFIPALAAAVTLLLFDKYLGTHFFDPAAGGDVLLYQNIFWFYSHPAVYVILLPALGILFEIVATMSKNPVFNYKACIYGGFWGTTLLAGEVWIHHLYVSGMPDWLRIGMMVSTILISIPVGLMTISLWGTLYRGAITFNTGMMYASGALFFLLLGGLTGIPNAMTVVDLHIGETSFVHSHFHYVMAMLATFALIGGVYYWFPKMTGKYANEGIGKLGFWLNFIGVNVTMFPLMLIGPLGMPRRYYDYPMVPELAPMHHLATYGSLIVLLGMAITLINWITSAIAGEKAPLNPWGSKSLEWTHTDSPPGPGNFKGGTPVITEDWTPYNYGK
ncbi:MAG: cbb3-type cytochrome c oxidase subunit I [Nitrospinae bacterium]|nr:cbb3-type cytochrome c oxidase subunit I [Nitrospinota bacterium]